MSESTYPQDRIMALRSALKDANLQIEAASKRRGDLIAEIAALQASFKVGDVVIGSKGKPLKIEQIIGKQAYSFRSDIGSLPNVEFYYQGRLILKNGSLGKNKIDTEYGYRLGTPLRLATDDEIAKPSGGKDQP